jgi:HD-like signal output (HDOD) protein
MSSIIESLKVELVTAIKKDQITLPTLPEVALQVRDAASDPDASVASLSEVLNTDAALSARVVKVANSPMLRGNQPIEDVKMAVGRLGLDYTANLATGLAMEQMFQATSDIVDQRMREVWTRSTEVAGICHVLCKHYTSLKPDQATLAGLIHKIGVLPILTFAEETHTELLDDPAMLDTVINDLSPAIGSLILKTWDFPMDIVLVPKEHVNFARKVEKVDYSDLVMVSVLQSYIGSSHPYTQLDWTQISAFDRVGLEPEVNAYDVEDLNAEMEAAMAMLQ